MSQSLSHLPDYISSGLSILFVGINPGARSAQLGHHFAGPSNRFWKLLFDSGLIPFPMTYQDDHRLFEYGYGLTNLIDRPTVGIQDLNTHEYVQGRSVLLKKIRAYQPKLVALLGIGIARIICSPAARGTPEQPIVKGSIQVGIQALPLEGVPVFVLPNPSGRNAHYSYQHLKGLFQELKQRAQEIA